MWPGAGLRKLPFNGKLSHETGVLYPRLWQITVIPVLSMKYYAQQASFVDATLYTPMRRAVLFTVGVLATI